MTTTPLAAAAIAQLEAEGVDAVIGTVVNPAGLTLAKTVPIRRTNAFADPGLGASPVWHGFAIDQTGIAFTERIGVVGDQRVRIDLSALRMLGDGLAWAPGSFFEQDGTPVTVCSRGTLGRIEAALAEAGIEAIVGHEIEFLLVSPDGHQLPSTLWAQYGLAGVLEHEAFVRDVTAAATASGVAIEQFHPEYGANQFEISLTPQSPVAAADQMVLTRIIIGRVARRHGLRVSLSPAPFVGNVGCGAHQHFSLTSSTGPLFSDGAGTRGMTQQGRERDGGAAARPAGGSGPSVRFDRVRVADCTPAIGPEPMRAGAPRIEKPRALRRRRPRQSRTAATSRSRLSIRRPIPTSRRRQSSDWRWTESRTKPCCRRRRRWTRQCCPTRSAVSAGIVRLSGSQAETIAALDSSQRMRDILGDPAVDVVVAVRRLSTTSTPASTASNWPTSSAWPGVCDRWRRGRRWQTTSPPCR